MAQDQGDWVNFVQIKAKVRFEDVLGHFGIWNGIDREGENLTGPCPICQSKGFKINLAKGSFSCPGCKKRGSVIDFTSAYKRVGLKEAGILLKGILEAQTKPQVKEAPGSGKSKKRKGKADKEEPAPAVASPDSGKENLAVVPAKLKEELVDIIRDIDIRIKEIADMTELLALKLEGKV